MVKKTNPPAAPAPRSRKPAKRAPVRAAATPVIDGPVILGANVTGLEIGEGGEIRMRVPLHVVNALERIYTSPQPFVPRGDRVEQPLGEQARCAGDYQRAEGVTTGAPVTPLQGSISSQRGMLFGLDGALNELEKCLTPVLMPEVPSPVGNNAAQPPAPPPEAAAVLAVRQNTSLVEMLQARVRNLINRVQA